MKMQGLFAQLIFSIALIQFFLTVLPFLHFGTIWYIICQCMLEANDLFLILTLYGVTIKKLYEYQKRLTSNFELLSIIDRLIDYGDFEDILNEFCIMLLLQAYGSEGVKCTDLSRYGPHRLTCLKTWPIGSESISKCCLVEESVSL